jgi:hypothetical protein
MDDRQLARLVDEVERTFPGDPAAQRQAWDLIETFADAWSASPTGGAPAVADVSGDRAANLGRLLAACRELVQDAAGRVAGLLGDLVPPDPAVVLADGEDSPTVDLDPAVAAEVGVEVEITVEVGPDSVTLVATIDESSTPERLAAVLQVPAHADAPTGETIVRRFVRIDPTLAAAYFEIAEPTFPLDLAVVLQPDAD